MQTFSTLPEYTTLCNLKCSSYTCCLWVVRERISRIHTISTVVSKFDRLDFSWLQHAEPVTACAAYCTRRCTKHASVIWTKWNGNWEWGGPSPGSHRHCGSHSSVAAPPISVRQGWWWTFRALPLTFDFVLLWIFVADDDMNSYMLFVGLFLYIVRSHFCKVKQQH